MTLRSSTNASMRTWRRYFPLVSVESVIALFDEMIQFDPASDRASALNCVSSFPEPNLAFISIILGYIESYLTVGSVSEISSTSYPKRSNPPNRLNGKMNRKRPTKTEHSSCSKRPSLRSSSPSIENTDSMPPSIEPLSVANDTFTSTPLSTINQVPYNTSSSYLLKPLKIYTMYNDQDLQQTSDTETPTDMPVSEGSFFPILRFEEAENLYQKFYSMIVYDSRLNKFIKKTIGEQKQQLNESESNPATASRHLIRTVCDVLCSQIVSARQREHMAHAQSVYSFLKTGYLDSFGLAFATVAACQLLGYNDVYLALSEDHAWVEFGPSHETADVMPTVESSSSVSQTSSDPSPLLTPDLSSSSYPPPVRLGHLYNSWLYLNGFPVICCPSVLSVAAAITAIQPCGLSKSVQFENQKTDPSRVNSPSTMGGRKTRRRITSGSISSSAGAITDTTSLPLVQLKRSLLWIALKTGLLSRYPLGLTNLADIEEGYPSGNHLSDMDLILLPQPPVMRPLKDIVEMSSEELFKKETEDIEQRTVPLKLLHRANYLHRHGDFSSALRYWAEAARVIGQYNHSSEDAEIYREFLTIATRIMPEIFKSVANDNRSCCEGIIVNDPVDGIYQPGNLLDSPLCLAYLLAFFDHLCLWEEGSLVPVLHVGWVDELMRSLTRFSPIARHFLKLEPTRLSDDNHHKPHHPNLQKTKHSNSPLSTSALAQHSDSGISSPVTRSCRYQQLKQLWTPSDTTAATTTQIAAAANSSLLSSTMTAKRDAPSPLWLLPSDEMEERMANGGEMMLTVLLPSASASPRHLPLVDSRPAGVSDERNVCCMTSDNTSSSAPSMTTGPPTGPQFLADELVVKQEPSQHSFTIPCVSPPLPPTTGKDSKLKKVAMTVDAMKTLLNYVDNDLAVKPLSKFEPQRNCMPKETLISYLAHASEYRLLNPAFLLGTDLCTPFLSPLQFDQLVLETERELEEAVKVGGESDYSSGPRHSFSSSSSSSSSSPSSVPPSEDDRLKETHFIVLSESLTSETIRHPCDDIDVSLGENFCGIDNLSATESKHSGNEHLLAMESDHFETNDAGNFCGIDNLSATESKHSGNEHLLAMESDHFETNDAGNHRVENLFTKQANANDDKDDDDIDLATLIERLERQKESPKKNIEQKKAQMIPIPHQPDAIHLYLLSAKMSSIAHLLSVPGRLNSSAIKLCLTAQSQVSMRRRVGGHAIGASASPALRNIPG